LRRFVAFLLAATIVGACGGGKARPSPVVSSSDLQQALDARGVGCDGYEVAKPGEKQKHVDQQAYCQIQGESAVLYVFRTPEDQQSWITLGVEAGCSFGLTVVSFVRGPNWIIQPETQAVSENIHTRFGGSVEVHRC
jgi:hypothetical protein